MKLFQILESLAGRPSLGEARKNLERSTRDLEEKLNENPCANGMPCRSWEDLMLSDQYRSGHQPSAREERLDDAE